MQLVKYLNCLSKYCSPLIAFASGAVTAQGIMKIPWSAFLLTGTVVETKLCKKIYQTIGDCCRCRGDDDLRGHKIRRADDARQTCGPWVKRLPGLLSFDNISGRTRSCYHLTGRRVDHVYRYRRQRPDLSDAVGGQARDLALRLSGSGLHYRLGEGPPTTHGGSQ